MYLMKNLTKSMLVFFIVNLCRLNMYISVFGVFVFLLCNCFSVLLMSFMYN